ncbi:SDR family NAD(P)-dependent oxidoreductase [Mesorhizobium australicum]|uniref:3-oxoacyl-[acyl-carrier protein] reductase n=1 Tax=Mesorhizobium australicum TaxID=536018 RepID=A0A1X7N1B3_9HYPH|nr:SDR family oxidoreductase [Mesorhizobium australicum]SMH30996.1 3-oxoacyl-[acyl-carrier protein] reductase [Mesorhizobium australicum]
MANEKEVALVTGAGRGIGLATTKRLLEDGFHVVMVDLADEPLATNAAALKAASNSVEHHALSITDRPAVAKLIASLPRLDVLVNNAAVFWDGKFDAVTEDDFRQMYDVNVVGTFVMAQEAAKVMKRGARIVNVASRAYLAGYAHSPYITSKAGAVGLTRGMAIDLAEKGIFVNAIAPGLIETDMFRSLTPERQAELIAKQPTKEVGQPEDIANGIAFFASPRTRNVTGQILTLDGGRSMGISIY